MLIPGVKLKILPTMLVDTRAGREFTPDFL